MHMFRNTPLPVGRQRDTLSECQATPLWSDLDVYTFATREHPSLCTTMLAQQFQHVIWHAVVVLSGTCDLQETLASASGKRKAKRCCTRRYSITLISSIWKWEGKGDFSYSLADIPRESQRPEADVLVLKATTANLAEWRGQL